MNSYQHSRRDDEHPGDDVDDASSPSTTGESGLVPIPGEERHAPPLDIDEREHRESSSEPIELPAHEEASSSAVSPDMRDQIDELLPLPTDEAYHDDDSAAPDPFDVEDQIDLTMPHTTGDAADEVDDFSTQEELDVDNAPAGRDGDTQGNTASAFLDDDRVHVQEPDEELDVSGAPVYIGGPSDDIPVNDESDFYPLSYDDEEPDGGTEGPEAAATTSEPFKEAEPTLPPPLQPDGATMCPVCGRQTDALRFCGYCGARLTDEHRELISTSFTGRLQERSLLLLEPLAQWTRPGAVRLIMAIGAVLVLFALLANNGALALIFGAAILPLILVFWCLHLDIFENESPVVIAGFGIAGTLLGAILGWLGSLIVAGSWFGTGVLNYGAAGFGGEFAERAGNPPFLVWSLVGIVFPLLALAAIIGGPLAMRQTIALRNEVMDGLTLGAVMGAGFSLGTAIVFAAPMLTHGGPLADASTWTLTTIGLTVIRPLVWTLGGGMLGAAAWRYLLTGRIGSALIPAIVGTAAPLLFTLMSIELSSTGLWPEIIWGALVAVIVGFFYKRTLDQAVHQDRKVLGNDDSRVICPACHQVTPTGQFCAHCGSDLHAMSAPV
jgi:hypothetical protein